MTSNKKTFKQKFETFKLDHPVLKAILGNTFSTIITILSAFIFAIGFKCFLAPATLMEEGGLKIVSGGMSGISQTIVEIIELCSGHAITQNKAYDLVFSILYFGLNIPVFIVAFFIGKRFFVYTVMNVGLVSLFTNLLGNVDATFIDAISHFSNENGGMLTRAIFAGVCTGLSSGLAFKIDSSAGGVDVISYFIAIKKNRLVGRYGLIINFCNLVLYTILVMADFGFGTKNATYALTVALFAAVYMFVVATVIDAIHIRNKKVKMEVVSSVPDIGKIVIANVPHGATVLKGSGAFSGKEKTVLNLVISSYEVNHTVEVVKKADPTAFIEVTELSQVYGRFFIPPIR